MIEEAVATTVPPLAGKTPKATLAAQLVYLVRDGLVVRKGKGLVALAPQGSGASGAKPPSAKKTPAKKPASRSGPPKADASG